MMSVRGMIMNNKDSIHNDNNDNDDDNSKSRIRNDPIKSSKDRRKQQKQNHQKKQQQRKQNNEIQTWRIFNIQVHPNNLNQLYTNNTTTTNESSQIYLEDAVLQSLWKKLGSSPSSSSSSSSLYNIRVVRRSLDARKKRKRFNIMSDPMYHYVIDMDLPMNMVYKWKLHHKPGKTELLTSSKKSSENSTTTTKTKTTTNNNNNKKKKKEVRVIIVGGGPAGLFCALHLAQYYSKSSSSKSSSFYIKPIILERGQPIERRGRDIGKLIHRHIIHPDSNFAYGEGGAGTWSDGKLTTRIGRNSQSVRYILESLVQYGASKRILMDGSPHLGTDTLVRIVRNARYHLRELGGDILFGTKVIEFEIQKNKNNNNGNDDDQVVGVHVEYGNTNEERHPPSSSSSSSPSSSSSTSSSTSKSKVYGQTDILYADAIVLATGHSAREMYQCLYKYGVTLEPKGFAVGYRVEHPQSLINQIQYGTKWARNVITGKSSTDKANLEAMNTFDSIMKKKEKEEKEEKKNEEDYENEEEESMDMMSLKKEGKLPVASYRLATNEATDGTTTITTSTSQSSSQSSSTQSQQQEEQQQEQQPNYRGVYSFCMCPGGQIVPSSTNPKELCINGMSFSRRDSPWANSALVITIQPNDLILKPYINKFGPILAGIEFQRDIERKAAIMGKGGNEGKDDNNDGRDFIVPVQRLTDFMKGIASTSSPSSSYRLGIRPSACHELYPKPIIHALRYALEMKFERIMPGYICEEGLLHGVETRTSSPVRIVRDNEKTMMAKGKIKRLFPAGEGAGYAGGIVSAAVDGMMVAQGVIEELMKEYDDDNDDDDDGNGDNGDLEQRLQEQGEKKKEKRKSIGFDY